MPVFYELTSPRTGRIYNVEAEADLPDSDLDALVDEQDFEAARAAGVQPGVDPAVLQQGPLGTFAQSIPQTFAKVGSGMISGAGRILDKASESLSQATGVPKGGDMFQRMADYGDELATSADITFPANPQNPVAGVIGGGAAQGMSLLAGGLAGRAITGSNAAMTAVPLASGFLSGANQGIQTAEEIGVQTPLAQLGTGMAFGGLEAFMERLGGIGSKAGREALTQAVRQTTGQLAKQAGKAIASEAIEEPLVGASQAALTRLIASEDPRNPGFTTTGVRLSDLAAQIVDLEARKLEAIGGAAGGTIFAGVQTLVNRSLPTTPDTVPPSATPGLDEDTGDLTAEDVADFERQRMPGFTDAGVGQTMSDPSADVARDFGLRRQAPGFRDNPLSTAPPATGDVITDLRIPRSPEAIEESNRIENERLAAAARLRMIDAKAQGMPLIPDSPSGSRDILDFANENPIYLPPGFSEQRNTPEYEKLKGARLPEYWRQFIASGKRGANPGDVAQRAFDAGFIAEPTADAYFEALRGGISGRQQYRVQFKERQQALAAEEKRVVDFEKSQDKLARKRKEPATPVAFEDIVVGDEMTIDGEPAVVRNVEYNEDGYLTNVVIEDGKRFGLMQFDPQSRSGLLVDEFLPAPRREVAADEFAPEDAGVGQTMSDPQPITPTGEAPTVRTTQAEFLQEKGISSEAGITPRRRKALEKEYLEWLDKRGGAHKIVLSVQRGGGITTVSDWTQAYPLLPPDLQMDLLKSVVNSRGRKSTADDIEAVLPLAESLMSDPESREQVVDGNRIFYDISQSRLAGDKTRARARELYEAALDEFDRALAADSLPADQPTSGDVGTSPAVRRDPSQPVDVPQAVPAGRQPLYQIRAAQGEQITDEQDADTGWRMNVFQDAVELVSSDASEIKVFPIQDRRSGSEPIRARIKALTWAADNPRQRASSVAAPMQATYGDGRVMDVTNQAQGRMEPLMSRANRLGRGLADLMPSGVSPSPSLPVSPSQSLAPAYTAAAQGSSTQMVPLERVLAAAQAQNPGLTAEAFLAQVRQGYENGSVMLEGAGSPQEAQNAGLTLPGTPVGTAVRMMVPPDGGRTNEEGRMRKDGLESPASQAIIAANQARNEAALTALGLPTKKGTRIWGREKVAEALRRISRDANQPATLRFMSRLLARMPLGNLLLKIEADARLDYAGLYQPLAAGRGEISLNTRRMSRGEASGQGDVVESLVHEVLHHVTYNVLRNPKTAAQRQAKADLEALRTRARAALSAQELGSQFDYELSDADEFISALFTRADFQTALAGIPLDAAPRTLGQRVRTMLDEVFRILAELVTGQKVEAGSVIEASFAAALRIMEDGGQSVQSRLKNAVLTQGPGIVSLSRDALRSIRAFHGTPHKVDKFTTSKIGTGEGAQAYGWGLYFAQGKAVAEQYSNMRATPNMVVRANGAVLKGLEKSLAETFFSEGRTAAEVSARMNGAEWQAAWNRIKDKDLTRGNLYTVELIPDEDEFLDWDKPLSEQSEKIRSVLAPLWLEWVSKSPLTLENGASPEQVSAIQNAKGSSFYEFLSESDDAETDQGDIRAASERLASLGIPGIRYLDGGSRGAGEGTRNFVVFDEKDIRITEENGQPVPLSDSSAPAPLQNPAAPVQNETQSRFAPPQQAQREIDGPRGDVLVAAEAQAWLGSRTTAEAVEAFAAQNVPLSLDTAERAAALLIAQLSQQATSATTETARLWAHVQAQRMGSIWKAEFMSADPARALRQRGVVNNTILAPIAPILAAQEILTDRGKKAVEPRFEGGTEGAVEKVRTIIRYVDRATGEILGGDLGNDRVNGGQGGKVKAKHPKLEAMLNALRKKMYPGMKWADIFTELPATQKERQREIYRRLMLDERLRSLTADERLALTNELDKAWQRERRKVFLRELEKAGVLGETDAKDREKVKAATPRLLRLMNLGMLNSELFREALAQEYGVKQITAPIAAELRALGERIQTAPEGLPRRKLEQQLVERLQSLVDATLWQTLDSWWTASVLSGWRTQVDIGLSIANGIEDVGLGSVVTALRTGNKDVAVRALGAMFGRIPSAFLEAVDFVTTGNKSMMRNFELETQQALEGGNRLASDVGRALWQKGGWRKVPGGFMVFYGRLMTALDHINSASTREGAKAMALARHPELYEKALRISAADRQAARTQARQELTAGAAPTTRQQRLEEAARIREILEQGTPAEVLAEATEVGRAAALQNDPTGIGGWFMDAVLSAVNTVNLKAKELAARENPDKLTVQKAWLAGAMAPVVRALTGTKFIRTVANSANRTLSYVPGVGVYAVGQQGRTGAFGDILVAKQVIGTLVGIALYLAFDDDDDEKGIEDGWKDKTPQQKAQLYAQGKQPFTVWTRDEQGRVRNWNYQQWGIAGIMNTVAAMLKQKGSEAGTLNVLTNSLLQGAMSFTDKAQLQGIQTILGENFRSTDPASGMAANLNKWAAQTVGGMVPRLMKDIDNELSPELRATTNWWQRWAKEVPMVRQMSSGKRVNILGEDIRLDRGPLSRVTQVGTADPAYRTLGRLNSRDIYLPDPTTGVRVVRLADGTRRPMTAIEKDRYQRLTGAAYRQLLTDEGERLLQMEPDEAQQRIFKTTQRLRDRAAAQAVR